MGPKKSHSWMRFRVLGQGGHVGGIGGREANYGI